MSNEPAISHPTAPPPENDFGQEYSLLKALNKLVRDYSLGVSLFKEFIQNADDAEATEIRFILDLTTQTSRAFHNPKLANVAGPSLLVWNNASFTEQDVRNIQSLGDTEKVLRPASTGKFGLGFNTCYNITDYPLLLTGSSVYLFDPHKTAYDYSKDAPPGKSWPLSSQLWSTSPDLLSPFHPLGLSSGQSEFLGTAFRLPLRTPDHDHLNGQIKRGEISPDKVRELFQEFTRFAPSILLFLKHLLRIEFLVIDSREDGPTSVLLIETANHEAVTGARALVNSAIKSDIPATLQNLRSQTGKSITSCFQHSVTMTYQGATTSHEWLVCTGLFRGTDDRLVGAATELWNRREKAIPWAGCACPFPVAGTAVPEGFQGHVFCFLPLPDALGGGRLPVHINGFFDIDTSRKGLTHEASASGSVERLRAEWNRTLIAEAVAAAYEKMLLRAVELNPTLDADTFYGLWLDPGQNFSPPLDSLAKELYAKLAPHKLLRSAAASWQTPAELRLVPLTLRPPLIAEKWQKVADPSVPLHIQNGFKVAEKPIKSLEASELRSFLETTVDPNCLLAESTRPALQNREWLIALAQCGIPKAPPATLANLPLLLLADGTLHTVGHRTSPAYLAGEAERKIFAQFPEWFIDADYAQAVSFPEVPSARVLKMTPEHVLTQLAVIVPKAPDKSFTTWTPNAEQAPNEQWLASVFQYFLDQPTTWKADQAAELMGKPCIVPDQHNRLWPPGNSLTPLLVPAGLDPRLRAALQALDVQVVTGGSKLLQCIESFATRFGKVWSVTPRDLADTLHESRATWSAKLPKYDSATCDPILQFFAGKESLECLAHPTDSRADKLGELPLFPCQNDDLVAITGNQCYIATEVTPPAVILPTRLLRPGTWKDLLVKLKVEPLKVRAIIQHVLLPNYPKLVQTGQLVALAWIRDHLEEALTEAGAEQDSLLSALRSTKLVLGSNGVLSECRHLYVPNNKTIQDVLGDRAVTPNNDLFGTDWNRWFPVFDRLGICKTPRPQDLACHIDGLKKLFETTEENGPAPKAEVLADAERQLVSVLQHIVQNWSSLREGQISLSGGTTISFKDFLRTRTWCPPLRGDRNLKHLLIAPEPPIGLFQPTQLYPPTLGHLVASVNHLLPIEQRDSIPDAIREIAPDVASPPVATVTAHFSNLLNKLNGNGPPDPKAIKTPLQRIYSYFGQLQGPDAEPVQAQFAAVDCIYVSNENKFRKPKDVFREAVPFASTWWSQSWFGDPEVEAGLALLGRKERPELADLCRLTREIHSSAVEPLNERETAQFIRILFRIEELMPEAGSLPELFLLDSRSRPVHPNKLFLHDAGWLDDKLTECPVHLHHAQLPSKLVARLGLKRLSASIVVEPEGEWPESKNLEFVNRCEAVEILLKTSEFLTGLRRILSRGSAHHGTLNLTWISATRILPVRLLECSHYIIDGDSKLLLAKAEELFFHEVLESGGHTLFLSEAGSEVLYEQVALALQRAVGPELLGDLSPLAKILQCQPDRIAAILDKLRVPRLSDAQRPEEGESTSSDGKSGFFDGDSGSQGGEAQETQQGQGQEGSAEQESEQSDGEKDQEGSAGKEEPADTDQEEGKRGDGEKSGDDGDSAGEEPPSGRPGAGAGRTENQDAEGSSGQRTGAGRTGAGTSTGESEPGWHRFHEGHRRTGAKGPREQHPKSRVVSYVLTDEQARQKEREQDPANDELPANHQIGVAAVAWVLQYERQQGRNPTAMPHNNPGYDVESRAPLKPVRYIEVKGIDGEWDIDGVPISVKQYEWAKDKADQFWLYVVEAADDPDKVKIYPIQNPIKHISQYRFDHGWKSLAAQEKPFTPLLPRAGLSIRCRQDDGEAREGTIKDISVTGGRQLLQVAWDNGHHGAVAFEPLKVELLPPPPLGTGQT